MSHKPIFVATHPRSCSTAFERVFMTCHDTLQCVHEPFGDAFYYGPERLSLRFETDDKGRTESGFETTTFKTVLSRLEKEAAESKRLFIKDMIYYLVPPMGAPPSIAPSLARKKRGVGTNEPVNDSKDKIRSTSYPYGTEAEPGNPTVVPQDVLERFHFTFLIRHPRYSIPSYYRCTVPPLDKVTGFYDYMPSEAGYHELRRVFDYLCSVGQVSVGDLAQEVGKVNGDSYETNDIQNKKVDVCVIDADDLLDQPNEVVEAFCRNVGIDFDEKMLNWDTEKDHQQAKMAFQKWPGFHDDAINSRNLRPRDHKKHTKSNEEEEAEWREKFGTDGAKIIRQSVNANLDDYEYLKRFALIVPQTQR